MSEEKPPYEVEQYTSKEIMTLLKQLNERHQLFLSLREKRSGYVDGYADALSEVIQYLRLAGIALSALERNQRPPEAPKAS